MKKNQFLLVFVMCILCIFCTACGTEEETGKGRDYYAIDLVTETLFSRDAVHNELRLLGTQYIDGQVVQMRAESRNQENGGNVVDVYACRTDGSKELVLEGISAEYQGYTLFQCADGDWLAYAGNELKKIDSNGETGVHTHVNGRVQDVCQLADGTIYALTYDEESKKLVLRKVDEETAEMGERDSFYLYEASNMGAGMHISEGEDVVYLLSETGIQSISLKNGSISDVVLFQKTGFTLKNSIALETFRMIDEKQAELAKGSKLDRISWTNLAEDRKVLIFSTYIANSSTLGTFRNQWLDICVAEFNKSQEEYYVVLEGQEEDESREDRMKRTTIELMTGGGPDIMEVSSIENGADLIEKGILLELNPYMEKSGIREEDYFPAAFEWYRSGESIYGITAEIQPIETFFPKWFLGDTEEPTIEELVDLLKNCDRKVYFSNLRWPEMHILKYLLDGSGNLWGMIDWTESKCEFDTPLFRDMLQIAKQYAWDEKKSDYEPLAHIIAQMDFYDDRGFELLDNGYVSVGRFFNDGVHPVSQAYETIVINAHSEYKEGAWEFLQYLLTEGQYKFCSDFRVMTPSTYPVNKAAYGDWVLREMEEGSIYYILDAKGNPVQAYKASYDPIIDTENGVEAYRELYDLTEERAKEIENILEMTRQVPSEILPILEMIYEEADAYFAGSKTIEEVIPIIENRVQLYLDERK